MPGVNYLDWRVASRRNVTATELFFPYGLTENARLRLRIQSDANTISCCFEIIFLALAAEVEFGMKTTKRNAGARNNLGGEGGNRAASENISNLTAKSKELEQTEMHLGTLMHDVARLRRSAFDARVRTHRVTRSQSWVLAQLGAHDGMIQSDLARLLGIGKAPLGDLLDRLEAEKFIERGPDALDRRARRVFLSKKGLGLIQIMHKSALAMSADILKGLSVEEVVTLDRLLTKVRENLRSLQTQK